MTWTLHIKMFDLKGGNFKHALDVLLEVLSVILYALRVIFLTFFACTSWGVISYCKCLL